MKWHDVYYNVYETNLNLIELKSDSLINVMDSLKLDSLNQTLNPASDKITLKYQVSEEQN